MFCTYCGTEVPAETNTCPKCGKVYIKAEDNISRTDNGYQNNPYQQQNQYQQNQYQQNQYQQNPYQQQNQSAGFRDGYGQYGYQQNQYQQNQYQQNQYQQNQYQQPYQGEQITESSTTATLALVFSILGGWLGLVLAIVGLCTYKTKEYKTRCGIALGISIAWIVILIILYAFIFSGAAFLL